MSERARLDSAARRPQTAAAPLPVVLTIDDDPRGGQAMADVVRIVLEEMREAQPGGDK